MTKATVDTSNTFTIAGLSKRNGGYKVRFSSNQIYVKLLAKAGDTDITLITLPHAMEKPEICKYLQTSELALNPVYKATIDEAVEKYSGPKYSGVAVVKPAKVAKPAKPAKAEKVAKPAKAEKVAKTTAKVTKAPKDKAAKLADLQARAAEAIAANTDTVTDTATETVAE